MNNRILSTVIVLFFGLFLVKGNAQTREKDTLAKKQVIEKWTILEEYEPNMIVSVQDRTRLKKERMLEAKRRKNILDTLNISDRKRRKLLKDLYKDPFSDRLLKTLADVDFEVGDD